MTPQEKRIGPYRIYLWLWRHYSSHPWWFPILSSRSFSIGILFRDVQRSSGFKLFELSVGILPYPYHLS